MSLRKLSLKDLLLLAGSVAFTVGAESVQAQAAYEDQSADLTYASLFDEASEEESSVEEASVESPAESSVEKRDRTIAGAIWETPNSEFLDMAHANHSDEEFKQIYEAINKYMPSVIDALKLDSSSKRKLLSFKREVSKTLRMLRFIGTGRKIAFDKAMKTYKGFEGTIKYLQGKKLQASAEQKKAMEEMLKVLQSNIHKSVEPKYSINAFLENMSDDCSKLFALYGVALNVSLEDKVLSKLQNESIEYRNGSYVSLKELREILSDVSSEIKSVTLADFLALGLTNKGGLIKLKGNEKQIADLFLSQPPSETAASANKTAMLNKLQSSDIVYRNGSLVSLKELRTILADTLTPDELKQITVEDLKKQGLARKDGLITLKGNEQQLVDFLSSTIGANK